MIQNNEPMDSNTSCCPGAQTLEHMPHTIRFALDGATARLTEKLQTDIAAERIKRRRSKRSILIAAIFGVLYAPPGIVFLSTQEGPLAALVAYLIVAPWLMLALPLYLTARRIQRLGAKGAAEFEVEFSGTVLHIRCGNLSSSVFPGGMKSVERLREHLALTLENFAVFLLPLSAFSSEEEIERWLSGLRGLCAAESTSAG
jgi:hypothetical protein